MVVKEKMRAQRRGLRKYMHVRVQCIHLVGEASVKKDGL